VLIRFLKTAAKVLGATILVTLVLEASLRPVAFFWHNRSQYYLYYGFHSLAGKVGVSPWSTFDGQHYKFPPHYVLRGAAGQLSETASINSRGFRGPDFEATKAPGVFRVMCLGASSTFGYHNGDQETYPFLLQTLFTRDALHAEAINAGFPYYNTGSILSLFTTELVSYRPDLITLYAGFNDTGWPTHIGLAGRLVLWVHSHSITYLMLREGLGQFVGRVERGVFARTIPYRLRDDELRRNSELVASRYRENVRSIVGIAKSRGIAVVVIKQPITTHDGAYLSMTYEEENRRIRERFERGEPLSGIETLMLRQHRLMEELGEIAAEENLPVVDNVRIVDQDRRRLASWVHLTAEANQRLAEALEAVIRPYIVKERAAAPARAPQSRTPVGSGPAIVGKAGRSEHRLHLRLEHPGHRPAAVAAGSGELQPGSGAEPAQAAKQPV
jgi:lysophospholipase L1-like esterase